MICDSGRESAVMRMSSALALSLCVVRPFISAGGQGIMQIRKPGSFLDPGERRSLLERRFPVLVSL